MARWIESWLPGTASSYPDTEASNHPGERFGLPASGVASVAGFGRRAAALAVDWLLAYLVTLLFTGPAVLETPYVGWLVLGVWAVLTALPVGVFGASAGMTVLGIRVADIGERAVIGLPRAVLRTALIALVVPPLVRDSDGRGWHDRLTRTIVVRTRA